MANSRYTPLVENNILEGTIKLSMKGFGYVDLPGQEKIKKREERQAVEIAPTNLNMALNGDVVKVLIHPKKGDLRLSGEVTEIITPGKREFVGVLEAENGFFYLVPDDKKMYTDILVDQKQTHGAKAGDKVLVKITKWEDSKKDPIGEVLEVIGEAGAHDTEMRAIVLGRGFKLGFEAAVEKDAERIKAGAAEDLKKEIAKRRDFRETLTFTIDPIDAKDFDDAISLKKLGDNKWEVGVHIADVSHYLQPGTELDKEARKRATSIYLVDRTIPMLPEILSNDLCSLNPNEDKLTFSAVFTMNENGEISDRWFGRTVIHSDKRFTYEEVWDVLQKKTDGPYFAELTTLNKLAYKLREKKFEAGAIAFETDEIKFKLDAAGKPIEVYKKTRNDAHLLVEDFMLLANRGVAEYVSGLVKDAENKFVYRIHDLPDPDKLGQLAAFLRPMGYELPLRGDGIRSSDLNKFLKSVEGKPEQNMIQTSVMRSMSKAIYAMKNIGHYGLAFAHYTHFTSPIRRYPDVMVHRLLQIYLDGQEPDQKIIKDYYELCFYTSQKELEAQDAERDSIKYKQVEYLAPKIGETFDALISGVSKWGVYVEEKESKAEGMVRLFEMKDDFYVFDEKNYCLLGQNSGKRFRLGDSIKVKLLKAEPKTRSLDFAFA